MIIKRIVDNDLNTLVREIINNADMDKINVARECKRTGLSRTSFYRYMDYKDYGELKIDDLNRFLNIFGYRLDMLLSRTDD